MKDKAESFYSIAKAVVNKLPKNQRSLAAKFIQQFFADVDWEDFRYKTTEDVRNLVENFWQFFYQRKKDKSSVEVINLGCVVDSWQCSNTSIMIVTNDAPFIMNSLQMELNRLGVKINIFLGYGNIKVKRDKNGCVVNINSDKNEDKKTYLTEGAIYIEVDEQTDVSKLTLIRDNFKGSFT